MAMKINNYQDKRYDDDSDSADTFTVPYNPQAFDDPIDTNIYTEEFPFTKHHFIASNAGIKAKRIVLQGHLSGTNNRVNYNTLAKHVTQAKLKKLYFGSDRFYIVVGGQLKQTNAARRTNFIDYVATFVSPLGFLLGDTQRYDTYTYGGTWSGGSVTNLGPAPTYVEKIEVTLDTGGASGETVIIYDNHSHGIQVTLGAYSEDDVLTIYLVSFEQGTKEIRGTKWWYSWQDSGSGSECKKVTSSGKYTMFLTIDPAENVNTITLDEVNSTAQMKTMKVYFRDGYYG